MRFSFFIALCLLLLGCNGKRYMTEKEYTEYVISRVETIPTLKKVRCPIMPEQTSQICYGSNLSLVDFAQSLRLIMYDDYKNSPNWQPMAGAYSGNEEAEYVTIKQDSRKYFSVSYISLNKKKIEEEESIGWDLSAVKKFKAYISFFFVFDQK
jgi:hypothetical protein